MWNMPDLNLLLWLAIIGLLAVVVTVVGGGGYLILWLIHHVQFI